MLPVPYATTSNGVVCDNWAMAFLTWLKRRKVVVLLLGFTFIVSGLLVNLVQLFTIPLFWINKMLFRKLNARIVYFHWCSKSSTFGPIPQATHQ